MKLSEIIKNCGAVSVSGSTDIEILDVTNDSRKVRPGSLFIAVNGCGNDGRAYIAKALENGASAIMSEPAEIQSGSEESAPTRITVADSRIAVAMAAPVRPKPKPATNRASRTIFVTPQAMLVIVPSCGFPAVMQKGCRASCSI